MRHGETEGTFRGGSRQVEKSREGAGVRNPFSARVIFDPTSKGQRYFCVGLAAQTVVTIHLHEKATPGPNPGDQITLTVDGSKKELTVKATDNTFEKIQNDNVKFKLKATPRNRHVASTP